MFFTVFDGFDGGGILPGVHGGEGGGIVAIMDRILEALTRDAESSWSLLGGIETLGANLHPLLLHFPIAFLTAFAGAEIFGLLFKRHGARRLASQLLYLGALSAVATVISGLVAAETVPHGAEVHEIMEWHERAGIAVASLSAVLAIWRAAGGIPASTMAQALSVLMTLILSAILFLGADLGGLMVYKHGMAVQDLQQEGEHQHHLHGGGTPPVQPDPANTEDASRSMDAEKHHGPHGHAH